MATNSDVWYCVKCDGYHPGTLAACPVQRIIYSDTPRGLFTSGAGDGWAATTNPGVVFRGAQSPIIYAGGESWQEPDTTPRHRTRNGKGCVGRLMAQRRRHK